MTTKAFCPECNRAIELEMPELGDFVTCLHCNTALEVIYLDPLQLDWPDEEGVSGIVEADEDELDL